MNKTNKVGLNNKASTPLSYNVDYIKLTVNPDNAKIKELDISNLVTHISVTEDIDQPGISVNMGIGDTLNLLENYRLAGNEKIQIKISRNSNIRGRESYNFTCYIAEIFGYSRLRPGFVVYQFRCISEHVFNNNLIVLKRAFQGTIGTVISSICKSDLKITNTDVEITEASREVVKGIYPRIRPINAIFWLMRNSYSDSASHFYFYESLAGGVKFKAYKELLDEDTFEEYIYRAYTKSELSNETDAGYEATRVRVISMSSEYNLSKFVSAGMGAYSSILHTVDISDKKYVKATYDYENHNELKLNKHKPFPTTADSTFLDRPLNHHIESKNYFLSLNSRSFNDHHNYHKPSGNIDLLKSQSYIENLNYMTHEITIPGDFNLSVGNTITLKVARPEEDIRGSNKDEMQSGKYLVTSIIHEFKEEYTQIITLQKDSSEVDLDVA